MNQVPICEPVGLDCSFSGGLVGTCICRFVGLMTYNLSPRLLLPHDVERSGNVINNRGYVLARSTAAQVGREPVVQAAGARVRDVTRNEMNEDRACGL